MELKRFEKDVEIIQKLGTYPNRDNGLTSEGLKKKFDEAPALIKEYLNEELVPAFEDMAATVGGGDFLRYKEQNLTPEQQEQARKNIDALKVPRGIARELFFFGEYDDFQTYGNQRIYKIAGQQVWLNSPTDFDFRVQFNIVRNVGQVEKYEFTKADCKIIETVQGKKHWQFFAYVSGSPTLVLTVANGIDPGSFESEPYCSFIYPSALENYSVEFFKLSETEQELNLVTSVNGIQADKNGNVEVAGGGSDVYILADGEIVEDAPEDAKVVIDPNEEMPAYVKTVNGIAPDKNGNVVVSGGGSGSGEQSDWNAAEGEPGHVLNRTHWSDTVFEEIFPHRTIETDESGYGYVEELPSLEVGATYIVTFNGVEYERVAYYSNEELGNVVLLGNYDVAVLGTEYTPVDGEDSWVIVDWRNNTWDIDYYMPNASINVGVKKKSENIHKLDEKFLPFGYPIMEKTKLASDIYTSVLDENYGVFAMGVEIGRQSLSYEFSVVYDGTEYNLSINNISGLGEAAGNLYLLNSLMGSDFNNTGEPFVVFLGATWMQFFVLDTESTDHNITVYTIQESTKRLDAQYAPKIPVIDLVELGLPKVTLEGVTTKAITEEEFTKIIGLLKSEPVMVRFKANCNFGVTGNINWGISSHGLITASCCGLVFEDGLHTVGSVVVNLSEDKYKILFKENTIYAFMEDAAT